MAKRWADIRPGIRMLISRLSQGLNLPYCESRGESSAPSDESDSIFVIFVG